VISRQWLTGIAGTCFVLVGVIGLLSRLGGSYEVFALVPTTGAGGEILSATEFDEQRARRQLERLAPKGIYVVIDTYNNRLRVYRNGELLRESVCSTGSRSVLRDPRTGRLWRFETPSGERVIERKVRDPVWIKPDWAFIEEGSAPPSDGSLRVDTDSLGDFALYLGDGYLIHGTLFQVLLGTGVTHGCIRLGDEDLEYLFRTAPVGTRVYIY
jgi:lipoprotein-anchoring transpeptidase ErfK/SrfK